MLKRKILALLLLSFALCLGPAYGSQSTGSTNPTGPAGGSLSGTYPNPGIAHGAITADAFATGSVTSGAILNGTIINEDINNSAAIAWSKVSKTGSNITDIDTRSHTSLTDIGTATHANIDTHISETATHGATGAVVGTTNTQTLSNKSLVGPILVTSAPISYESTRVYTSEYSLVDKKYVDDAVLAIGSRFFMLDAADATVAAYKQTAMTATSDATASVNASVDAATDTLIEEWISPSGITWSSLAAGVYDLNVFAARTAGNREVRVFWRFYERKADTSETLIATSNLGDLVTTKERQRIYVSLGSAYTPEVGSRLVGKIYFNTAGGSQNTTCTIYYQGDEDSHWQTPADQAFIDATYVPYTGANAAVNLGTQSLTTANLKATGVTTLDGTVYMGTLGTCSVDATNFYTSGSISALNLNITNNATAAAIYDSGLTATRLTYAGTAGKLVDSANLSFNGTTLTILGSLKSGSIESAVDINVAEASPNRIGTAAQTTFYGVGSNLSGIGGTAGNNIWTGVNTFEGATFLTLESGSVLATKLQNAATDLGNADISVNLSNSNVGNVTSITTNGNIISTGGALTANVVAEYTGAAGVTVDGTLLKDGGITTAPTSNDLTILDGNTVMSNNKQLVVADFPNPTTVYIYNCDNGSSTNFSDVGGNSKTLTLTGTLTTTYDVLGVDRYNVFDGTNDYLSSTDADFATLTGDFSLGGWFKANDWTPADSTYLMSKGSTSPQYNGFRFYVDSAGNLSFITNNANVDTSGASFPITNLINYTWHHFVVARDADGYISIYLDGELAYRTADTSQVIGVAGTLEVGSWSGGTLKWAGAMDEVFIHNGTILSADQVRKIYNRSAKKFAVQDANANIVMPQNVSSGIYTPTLADPSNVETYTAFPLMWQRIGNIVHVAGQVNVNPTNASPTGTSFTLTFPIVCATTPIACGGSGGSYISGGVAQAGFIASEAANKAIYRFDAQSTANANHAISFSYVLN